MSNRIYVIFSSAIFFSKNTADYICPNFVSWKVCNLKQNQTQFQYVRHDFLLNQCCDLKLNLCNTYLMYGELFSWGANFCVF